jgi:hypothetical protein
VVEPAGLIVNPGIQGIPVIYCVEPSLLTRHTVWKFMLAPEAVQARLGAEHLVVTAGQTLLDTTVVEEAMLAQYLGLEQVAVAELLLLYEQTDLTL